MFFSLALVLCCALAVGLLSGLIEWLQVGRWKSVSLLQAGYDINLLRARWFMTTDWGWRLHDVLESIPLYLVGLIMAPLCWRVGLVFVRR